jgi:hypothetical protein
MEQLDNQTPATEVALDPAILERIDPIVKPGVNLNPADTSYGEQVLQPPFRIGDTSYVRVDARQPPDGCAAGDRAIELVLSNGKEWKAMPATHVLESRSDTVSPGVLDPSRPPALTIASAM